MNRLATLALVSAIALPAFTVAAFAVDDAAIKPQMQVQGENGKTVGTVEKVENHQIILTKGDAGGGEKYQLPVTAADHVAKNVVTLKTSAENAMAAMTPVKDVSGK